MSFICIESHELIFVALVAYFEMQSDYCDSPGKDRTDALWVIMVPPHKEHLLFFSFPINIYIALILSPMLTLIMPVQST